MHYADLITAITPANFHGIFRLLYLFQTLNCLVLIKSIDTRYGMRFKELSHEAFKPSLQVFFTVTFCYALDGQVRLVEYCKDLV